MNMLIRIKAEVNKIERHKLMLLLEMILRLEILPHGCANSLAFRTQNLWAQFIFVSYQ